MQGDFLPGTLHAQPRVGLSPQPTIPHTINALCWIHTPSMPRLWDPKQKKEETGSGEQLQVSTDTNGVPLHPL